MGRKGNEVADRRQELAARDALSLDILRLAEDLNIELAFPTPTIRLAFPGEVAGQAVSRQEALATTAPGPT